jgi:hypothetical protein
MGVSEQALGRTLGNRRNDVCLVTKVGVGYYPETSNRRDSSRQRIMDSIEQSLRALSTVGYDSSAYREAVLRSGHRVAKGESHMIVRIAS